MAIDRNDPEIKALLEEAVKDATDALAENNRKLVTELKNARAKAKGADIDPEEHAKLTTEVEDLRGALAKAEKTGKAEVEKLTKQLSAKSDALNQHLIDGGLTDALVKAGAALPYMPAVKAMLKSQTSLKEEGGNFTAMLGDKPLTEAVAAFLNSEEGKHYKAAPTNNGGGAGGGGGGNTTKGKIDGTEAERAAHFANKFNLTAA